jgi:hypothetical protein
MLKILLGSKDNWLFGRRSGVMGLFAQLLHQIVIYGYFR